MPWNGTALAVERVWQRIMQLLRSVSPPKEAALHRNICCLSVYLRSPVPPRLRGLLLSHFGSEAHAERRRMRLATALLAFAYLATLYLIIVLVMVHRGALKVSPFQGRRHGGHRATQGQERTFTLKDRQTILNRATQHWYTRSTRRRAISVFRGHRVYESRVERFRGWGDHQRHVFLYRQRSDG